MRILDICNSQTVDQNNNTDIKQDSSTAVPLVAPQTSLYVSSEQPALNLLQQVCSIESITVHLLVEQQKIT